MKPRILQLLVFVLLVGTWGSAEALEPLKLYDNFEQTPIDINRWVGVQFEAPFRFGTSFLELVRKTTPEEHHLRILNRSFGLTFSNGVPPGNSLSLFRLGFTRPDTITAIRSRVKVRNVESRGCPVEVNSTPTSVNAQIFGFFFNTVGPGSDGTNDVIAGLGVRRDSDSGASPDVLEIVYFVDHCLDFNCVNSSNLAFGSLGTVTKGEWVRLLLQWDKEQHRFIFQRDIQLPAIFSYGDKITDTAEPGIQSKTIGAHNGIANCNSFSPRPVGMVDALFDNVFVNESAQP